MFASNTAKSSMVVRMSHGTNAPLTASSDASGAFVCDAYLAGRLILGDIICEDSKSPFYLYIPYIPKLRGSRPNSRED